MTCVPINIKPANLSLWVIRSLSWQRWERGIRTPMLTLQLPVFVPWFSLTQLCSIIILNVTTTEQFSKPLWRETFWHMCTLRETWGRMFWMFLFLCTMCIVTICHPHIFLYILFSTPSQATTVGERLTGCWNEDRPSAGSKFGAPCFPYAPPVWAGTDSASWLVFDVWHRTRN